MKVLYANYKLKLFQVKSLKEKRAILKHLINILRKDFNLSVAEGGSNDSKEYMEVSIASLSQNEDFLLNLLDRIEEKIERITGFNVIDMEYYIY